MELTVKRKYLDQEYELTFKAPSVVTNLERFAVEERIARVMNRELNRFSEITAVGLKDNDEQERIETIRRSTKRDGMVLVNATTGRKSMSLRAEVKDAQGPNVSLGVGTKDPIIGRLVHDGTEEQQIARRQARQAELKKEGK